MNENFSENSKKIDIKVDELETPGSINPENEEAEEKPLEEMSKDDLIKKIEKLIEESRENYDRYLRSQAEMDNIIKRNKKEKEEWIKYSNETLIKDLLQVIDNLENAINHSENENSFNALIEGVELTLKGLKDTLAKSGLTESAARKLSIASSSLPWSRWRSTGTGVSGETTRSETRSGGVVLIRPG